MAVPQEPVSAISVIIASRGRAEQLQTAIGSLYRAQQPSCGVQLVLIASGSSETLADMQALAASAPQWISAVVVEGPAGKTKALNAGLPHCTGDVIVFTDDDVTVCADYFNAVLRGFAQTRSDALQGQVRMHLLGTRPRWFTPGCADWMAATNDLDARPAAPLTMLNSCNMAVRKEVALEVGPFSEMLGPGTRQFPLGDDAEWSMRLLKQGYKATYWPDFSVYHELPPERVSFVSLCRRAYICGVFRGATGYRERWRNGLLAVQDLVRQLRIAFRWAIRRELGWATDAFLYVWFDLGILIALAGKARNHPCAVA